MKKGFASDLFAARADRCAFTPWLQKRVRKWIMDDLKDKPRYVIRHEKDFEPAIKLLKRWRRFLEQEQRQGRADVVGIGVVTRMIESLIQRELTCKRA